MNPTTRRLLTALAASVSVLVVPFAITSFVKWDLFWLFDVADWSRFDRGLLLYVSAVFALPAALVGWCAGD